MSWKSAPPGSTRALKPRPVQRPPTIGMTRRTPAATLPISIGDRPRPRGRRTTPAKARRADRRRGSGAWGIRRRHCKGSESARRSPASPNLAATHRRGFCCRTSTGRFEAARAANPYQLQNRLLWLRRAARRRRRRQPALGEECDRAERAAPGRRRCWPGCSPRRRPGRRRDGGDAAALFFGRGRPAALAPRSCRRERGLAAATAVRDPAPGQAHHPEP